MKRNEFQQFTKQLALKRQKNKCASCGTKIFFLGQIGQSFHKYGEGARAHHMRHCQQGGDNSMSNCVVLCHSCHYSVHEGGRYRNSLVYLISHSSDYKYFKG